MKYNLSIVLAFFHECGLPEPEPEFEFCMDRKWRFDFAWPKYKLALEVEGGVFVHGRHTRGSGFVKDMEKYNTAAMLGWKILRVQPKDLCMQTTVEMIARVINEKT